MTGSYSVSGAWLVDSKASFLLSWLAAMLIFGLSVALLAYLDQRRPTSGAAGSVTVQILFSLYLLLLAGLYLRGTAHLWQQWDLEQTPRLLLGLGLAGVCVYSGCLGERAVGRLALPVLFWLLLTAVLDLLLLLPEASVSRLTLDGAQVEIGFTLALYASLLLPLLAVWTPGSKGAAQAKALPVGAAIGGVYLLSVVIRSLLLLGDLALIEPYPLLRTLMLIAAGSALNHLEFGGVLALSAAVLTAAGAASARLFSLPLWQGRRRLLAVFTFVLWLAAVFLPGPYLL